MATLVGLFCTSAKVDMEAYLNSMLAALFAMYSDPDVPTQQAAVGALDAVTKRLPKDNYSYIATVRDSLRMQVDQLRAQRKPLVVPGCCLPKVSRLFFAPCACANIIDIHPE